MEDECDVTGWEVELVYRVGLVSGRSEVTGDICRFPQVSVGRSRTMIVKHSNLDAPQS